MQAFPERFPFDSLQTVARIGQTPHFIGSTAALAVRSLMLQFFINPFMLLGLAGIGLPVIAHLLSRRKFDVIQWGAMQFLNPSRRTRRKMKLEELLLLLIRILAIAMIALAAARPWINSGFLTGYESAGSRDVVLVIDSSNSMSRSDGLTTLHQKAIRRAADFLETLSPSDTVTIIDARDKPFVLLDSPIQDRETVAELLEEIPPPGGASDLQQACEEAIGILGRGSNGSREVVVFTDRQRNSWDVTNDQSWKRFDDILKFPSVKPSVWVMDVGHGLAPISQNISLGQLKLSRDLTVPDFPVRLEVDVLNSGKAAAKVPLQILINGQRLAGMDETIDVPGGSQTTFSRSVRFNSTGVSLLSVKADLKSDPVQADNQSHAAIRVDSAIPVLLVESSTETKRTRWNTFFAQIALTSPQNKNPWIVAKTIKANELSADDFDGMAAVVLPSVSRLSRAALDAVREFVADGHGAMICLGPESTPESFDRLYAESGLLPTVRLKEQISAVRNSEIAVTIAPYSLEAGWLNRFREREGASLIQAAFESWWHILPNGRQADTEAEQNKPDPDSRPARPPAIIAQLTSGHPLLLQGQYRKGTVLLMGASLDASMSGLVATPDYVPFIHEALFQMASSRIQRNVVFGQPLVTKLEGVEDTELVFTTPDERTREASLSTPVQEGDSTESTVRMSGPRIPGVFLLHEDTEGAKPKDSFVVNYDHIEDDQTELTEDDYARLTVNNRMKFVTGTESLVKGMYQDESTSELWALLLWLFLILLAVEVWMTRRLVLGGHADANAASAASLSDADAVPA